MIIVLLDIDFANNSTIDAFHPWIYGLLSYENYI